MSMSDPISDLCTRIRNAKMRNYPTVIIPHSKIKEHILEVLQAEGFIVKWEFKEMTPQSQLIVSLKYDQWGESVIRTIKRISKPGCRVHKKVSDIKPILGGQGIAVVTTSAGVMSDRQCREKNTGGEVLCHVW
ncbi:MAG: 30S ribosomal protein S8 [SAR324 cluster bacterium]|nr:30S ribosomal protein S8 [SAR324 cluster bacterium]